MVKTRGKTGTELEEGLGSAEAQLPARRGQTQPWREWTGLGPAVE